MSVLPPAGGERQSLQQQQQLGLWVIAGFLTFLALEKMFLDRKEQEETNQVSPKPQDLGTSVCSVVVPGPGGPGSELNPEKRVSWPFLGTSQGWAACLGIWGMTASAPAMACSPTDSDGSAGG